jgi:hypothetical protein
MYYTKINNIKYYITAYTVIGFNVIVTELATDKRKAIEMPKTFIGTGFNKDF